MRELHRQGWIHGDIKPSNIMVGSNGHATLLDLGLAQRLNPAETEPLPALRGTLQFAAPEVLTDSGYCCAASDVYSLGVTLFWMLSGRPPFTASAPEQMVGAHLYRDPPDVRTVNPRLTAEVAELIQRMLDKRPEHRPQDDELLALLSRLEDNGTGIGRVAA
jgi:serine/threonine-protein kinase